MELWIFIQFNRYVQNLAKISKNPRKNTQNSRKNPQNSREKLNFWVMWKRCPKKTLDAFIHFHTLSYALEGFTCFHMLLYAFISFYMILYAFICFYILSYIFIYTFIRFYMLLFTFYMLSYAFKRKKAKRPLALRPPPSTYTNVWLSRCAAGNKHFIPSIPELMEYSSIKEIVSI